MPDLRVGATKINKVYLGSTALSRVYLGSDLLWQAVSDFDLTSANTNPRGIAWDGTYYRVVDIDFGGTDKVYTYDAQGDYVSAEDFDLTALTFNGQGIEWDGAYYRVVDTSRQKVFAYNAQGVYVPAQDFDVTGINTNPRDITWNGTYLLINDTSDRQTHAYNAQGVNVPAEDFIRNAVFSNFPRGIAWDGTYYRVVNSGTVYAYDAQGDYVSAQDFDLTSANANPSGITWDGGVFPGERYGRPEDFHLRLQRRLRWRPVMTDFDAATFEALTNPTDRRAYVDGLSQAGRRAFLKRWREILRLESMGKLHRRHLITKAVAAVAPFPQLLLAAVGIPNVEPEPPFHENGHAEYILYGD